MKSTQGTALSRAKRCTAASKASVILASGAVEAIQATLNCRCTYPTSPSGYCRPGT